MAVSFRPPFAAIKEDGSVVTWGHPEWGGDSSGVQHQLSGVVEIQASHAAFAAILEDRSVVTWGDPSCGGDSSAVREQLLKLSLQKVKRPQKDKDNTPFLMHSNHNKILERAKHLCFTK